MTFAEKLQDQLDTDASFRNSATGKRAAKVLSMPTRRRERVLARMEDHALVHIGKQGQAVDWSRVKSVDWKSILELLIKLLPLILALFA